MATAPFSPPLVANMAFVSTFDGQRLFQCTSPSPPGTSTHAPCIHIRRPPTAMFGLGRARDVLRAREAAARLRLWRLIDAARRAEVSAVVCEDFRTAAAARDRVSKLSQRDPYIRVQSRLQAAVEAERFMQAARLRDTLMRIEPPPVVLTDADADFDSWRKRARWEASRVVTHGVAVDVCMEFDNGRSHKQRGALAVFKARVQVANLGEGLVQIVGRRWTIEEFASGNQKCVEGCGVGARRVQPVLAQGDTFVWETAVPVAVLGLASVPRCARGEKMEEIFAEREGGKDGIAVGAFSGVLEVVGGDVGERQWDAPIGEALLMLPS